MLEYLTLLAGGAERLVVDAACGLQDLGHHVHIYTSHWEKERCFEETRNGARITLSIILAESASGYIETDDRSCSCSCSRSPSLVPMSVSLS